MLIYPQSKINIGLNIVEKRADGYHNLETIFYPIDLSDSLQVERDDLLSDICFVSKGLEIDCEMEDNLIVRIYRQFQQQFQIGGVRVLFEKKVPVGAGLGGGSADAAAMACALNQLFELRLTEDQLRLFVSPLGADCAFFISPSPQYATGIGNQLSPIQINLSDYYFVLIKPDVAVSTAQAYQGIVPTRVSKPLCQVVERYPVRAWRQVVVNDFEDSVFRSFPEIAAIKQELYQCGALYASMTGSGAAVYGLFEQKPIINRKPTYFYYEQQLKNNY